MRFAKIAFLIAGIWGFIVLIPLYFMFRFIGRQTPPDITHPEYYFGFLAAALVWQIAFFVIATDPVRFRSFMVPAILEKWGYVATLLALYDLRWIGLAQLLPGLCDFVLGIFFIVSYIKTRSARAPFPR